MDTWKKRKTWLVAGVLAMQSMGAWAAEFSASFKGTDIQEFIEIVGRNLEKTIIVDPAVRGKVNVRSYDVLNDDQYYQFFLNVLEVYGFAVVEMENGVLKVIRDKDAKQAAVPVVGDDNTIQGDAVITRVVSVKNVTVRELSPLLRQLIDNAGAGNVVHYDPANVIMITGRAAVVNRLAEIIDRVDRAGDTEVEIVNLNHASASEMVRIVESLHKQADGKNTPALLQPSFVADERTNSILVSGEPQVRERIRNLIRQLDREMATTGNNRVVYLRYAKAEDVVDVLQGVSDNLIAEKQGGQKSGGAQAGKDVKISAHKGTNALVITAPPDIMRALESVISQLDIRRAQVLIEAMIVEISESDGANLGVQWGSLDGGGIQFGNTGVPITNYLAAQEQAKDTTTTESRFDKNNNLVEVPITKSGDPTAIAEVLGGVSGLAAGVVFGDWTALVTAVSSNSDSNILSSPSLMVLDNEEASFIVGEEVPVVTGSATGSNNDNPFQTVERKDVGIKLKVTPQINEGDSVQLSIEQEISNVLGASGAVDIRFGKRQLTTSILAADQQMIVLSGLIDEQTNESEQKVPILGDIPFLGHLFKSTSSGKTKRNLMLFIKPTIIRTGLTADGITQRKYNYIRAEQIFRAQEEVKLMPGVTTPVLPEFGNDLTMPAEIRAILSELR
ncbi:type II secretion system protein GspD [Enterovibrio norvegicus]|uniref:General secretion pathway protein D n=2 Tax=Enterovibrio norvegicus TaxID=188144 RepID=A0A1I5RZW2_9GAMM|nr:type II secretion system secretin GspD [Enterovibrio norvegicus]OEF49101.1 type II secretion system protein GspD [Enterovibrio norvegicus]OEF59963.1 type II secretion system protein GspD [Enterovibrio norvegicus]SFP63821.1 general secretion pathway protein D [Enterovibrio norvegicus DSM 15893]